MKPNRMLLAVHTILLALVMGAIAASAREDDKATTAWVPEAQPKQPIGRSTQPLTPLGSGFTYQGQLKDGGNPANGQYDFIFTLYDAETAGNQVGSPITRLNQNVSNGIIAQTLDFGAGTFQGQALWLDVQVRQAGGGSYTTLSPRQAITAVPNAMSLVPGSVMTGAIYGPALAVTNTIGGGVALYGSSPNGFGGAGVYGWSAGGVGVQGGSSSNFGVYGHSYSSNGVFAYSVEGHGVRSESLAPGRAAVHATGDDAGYGVDASGGTGVRGLASGGYGVYGITSGGASMTGVYGESSGSNSNGVIGVANNGTSAYGVWGRSSSGIGVYGHNFSGSNYGVYGRGGIGVYGLTNHSNGVGVRGDSQNGYGVHGVTTGSGFAGWFQGQVNVTGYLYKSGGGFKIDHPLDPANKYLYHSFVESPDMKNIYDGNVTTDANGEAEVVLPEWFEAVNKDFRYQLTTIGQFAQAIVSTKIKNNTFTIKTDKPNVEVSWQVTGIRKDAYAQTNRIPVEEEKEGAERGKYRHPQEHGQPESKGIDYERIKQKGQMEEKALQEQPGEQKPAPGK